MERCNSKVKKFPYISNGISEDLHIGLSIEGYRPLMLGCGPCCTAAGCMLDAFILNTFRKRWTCFFAASPIVVLIIGGPIAEGQYAYLLDAVMLHPYVESRVWDIILVLDTGSP